MQQAFKKQVVATKMPAIGNETVFPRKDNAFKAKNCLNYNDSLSKVWQNRPRNKWEGWIQTGCFILIGILIAICALIMDIIEEGLIHFKDHQAQ